MQVQADPSLPTARTLTLALGVPSKIQVGLIGSLVRLGFDEKTATSGVFFKRGIRLWVLEPHGKRVAPKI